MKTEKILVVEDSKTILRMLTKTIEMVGFEVIPALNGYEAFELALKYEVDPLLSG